MRSLFALVLIVCGTLLAAAPVASDFMQGRQIAQFASERPDFQGTMFFRQPLDENYCVASWILGGAMIGLGIIRSWHPASAPARESRGEDLSYSAG